MVNMSDSTKERSTREIDSTESERQNYSIAVGFPVVNRLDCLTNCLDSVPDIVSRVVIADNGPPKTASERKTIYNQEWPFELTIRDLDYDVGIGSCRAAIGNEVNEDYLLVIDSDMIVPTARDIERLRDILEARPSLGGVSGIIIEDNRLRAGATNFHEDPLFGGKTALVHSVRDTPNVKWVGKTPIIKFDKLTNAALLRREAIDDYGWDDELVDMEHLDFYVGHWQTTDWSFAVCPNVIFDHRKDMNRAYRETYREGNRAEQRRDEAFEVFHSKWGYNRVVVGRQVEWLDSKQRPTSELGFELLRRLLPTRYTLPLKDLVDR